MENYQEWFPGVINIQSANDLNHGVIGKKYIEILEFPQGTQELLIEVKDLINNSTFVTEGDLEPIQPRMEMGFLKLNKTNCEFSLTYFCRNQSLNDGDEIITSITKDLSERIITACNNLKLILEGDD